MTIGHVNNIHFLLRALHRSQQYIDSAVNHILQTRSVLLAGLTEAWIC